VSERVSKRASGWNLELGFWIFFTRGKDLEFDFQREKGLP
jgi:hypothetical protein